MKAPLRYTIALMLAAVALPIHRAEAQTNFSVLSQFGSATGLVYIPFHVAVGGTFTIQTSGLNQLDPMILLFAGQSFNGSGLGALLAFNDDGAPAQPGWNICSGAGGTCNSLITTFLAAGDYTVAAGTYTLTEADARAGVANPANLQIGMSYCSSQGNFSNCNYTVAVTSRDGQASVTPEPVTVALLATGLLGIGGVARRRRRNAAV